MKNIQYLYGINYLVHQTHHAFLCNWMWRGCHGHAVEVVSLLLLLRPWLLLIDSIKLFKLFNQIIQQKWQLNLILLSVQCRLAHFFIISKIQWFDTFTIICSNIIYSHICLSPQTLEGTLLIFLLCLQDSVCMHHNPACRTHIIITITKVPNYLICCFSL